MKLKVYNYTKVNSIIRVPVIRDLGIEKDNKLGQLLIRWTSVLVLEDLGVNKVH